jgi:hypothetical protein
MFHQDQITAAHTKLFVNQSDPDPEEQALFTGFGSLRRFVPSEQKLYLFEYGFVRILRSSAGRYRLLMRNQDASAVLVNHYILPGMQLLEGDLLTYSTLNHSPASAGREEILFYTFAKADDAASFRREYTRALEENEKQLRT